MIVEVKMVNGLIYIVLFYLLYAQSALHRGTTHPFTRHCTQTLEAKWVKGLAPGHYNSVHLRDWNCSPSGYKTTRSTIGAVGFP